MTTVGEPARDWTYDALVREGLSLIPAYAPNWTDHNPSDPGITLLELLAYLTDILCYRAGRVTLDAKLNLLALLGGTDLAALIGEPRDRLDRVVAERLAALANMPSLVTARDFEERAELLARAHDADGVYRVRCLPAPALAGRIDGATAFPSDLFLIVAEADPTRRSGLDALCREIEAGIEPDRPLSTHVRAIPATHVEVALSARIMPSAGASMEEAAAAASAAVQRVFSPWSGEAPFGRALQMAMVAAAIDAADGVDYVDALRVEALALREAGRQVASAVGVRIGEYARPREDAYLGGAASAGQPRFTTDETGEIEAVAAELWEVLTVSLPRASIRMADADE